MSRAIYLNKVEKIQTGYEAKGFVWDGSCYCTAVLFYVTINTEEEVFEYEIKRFLKSIEFKSGDNLDFVRV